MRALIALTVVHLGLPMFVLAQMRPSAFASDEGLEALREVGRHGEDDCGTVRRRVRRGYSSGAARALAGPIGSSVSWIRFVMSRHPDSDPDRGASLAGGAAVAATPGVAFGDGGDPVLSFGRVCFNATGSDTG